MFFYAHSMRNKKRRGFIGYGHYDSTKRLTLNRMWKLYGSKTGYDNKEDLENAISKASKGKIPDTMLCLYLTDVVFFTAPVYPKEVGLSLPGNLESYTYIDKDDPTVTVRILRQAAELGIDIWTKDSDSVPEEIFRYDEIKHVLALAAADSGKETGSEREKAASHRLAKERIADPSWQMIKGSKTDCLSMTPHEIKISVPFTYNVYDRQSRTLELLGRMTYYKIRLIECGLHGKITFSILSEKEEPELEQMVARINGEL